MKQSKSRLARAAAEAARRAEGPPKVSKYAAKRRRQGEFAEALDAHPPTVEDLAAKYARNHR